MSELVDLIEENEQKEHQHPNENEKEEWIHPFSEFRKIKIAQ